jgi:hypothetical protein
MTGMVSPPDAPEPVIARALGLADAAWRDLFGPARGEALDRLEREYEPLRQALEALIARGDTGRAERLIRPLRDFWWARRRLDEGQALIGRALALPERPATATARAALLDHAGALAVARDDPGAARRHFEAALTIRRASGTAADVASSLHHLASVLRWKHNDPATAHALYAEALTHARAAQHRVLTAAALLPLGTLALDRGDLGQARARLTEGLTLFVAAGMTAGVPVAMEQFAALAAAEGDPGGRCGWPAPAPRCASASGRPSGPRWRRGAPATLPRPGGRSTPRRPPWRGLRARRWASIERSPMPCTRRRHRESSGPRRPNPQVGDAARTPPLASGLPPGPTSVSGHASELR